jgi:pimeloyl-ACP methyl ester carboxylesterase
MDMTYASVLPRPGWLPENVWPFETRAMRIAGRTIAFTDVGSGPVLLFVHTGLWSFVWRDVLVRLSDRCRCVCLDAPANGQSEPPNGGVTLSASADAVAGLIDMLGIRELTLVVHDLGGLAGVAGASRSSTHVSGIVAVNAFAWRPEGMALRTMLAVMGSGAVRELDAWTDLVPRITATRFGVGRRLDAASRRAFLAGVGPRGVRAFHDYLHDALRCDALHAEADAALHGRFAPLPLLTVFGERNDPFHFQQGWRRRYRHALQLVIKGGNHFPMCDDPGLVADAISRFARSS